MKKYNRLLWILVLLLALGCSSDSNSDGQAPPEEVSNPTPDPNVDRSGNLLATGASANDILSNNSFTSLRIEIAFVTGFRPTTEAISEFTEFLGAFSFKEDIEIVFNELPATDEEDLTLQEIADLETANRTVYNDGNTLGIYIYFADAPSDGDDLDSGLVTLGAVYRNTSMVIYESTIRILLSRSNSSAVTLANVETATLNHEFGHLFGLVNLGSPAVNDHEDAGAPNHCNVPGCLMRAELEFGSGMMNMMENMGVVPVLDAECILDIQANGAR
ncbi:hypothetical protein [Spongiimicrobium salis]|uniref:hypothetical protein n=1 Tax=Spongiimicrobium salis TaxID=1667022 RepID=UPI00374DE86B